MPITMQTGGREVFFTAHARLRAIQRSVDQTLFKKLVETVAKMVGESLRGIHKSFTVSWKGVTGVFKLDEGGRLLVVTCF